MAETGKRRLLCRGYTIVEAMIVLVAIGLILGGILKGQELINNAKVRALTDRTATIRVAWRNFVLRYGWEPGNFPLASTNIAPGLGDGNGEDGFEENEGALAMSHLHASSLIRCPVCTSTELLTAAPSTADHPSNGFGGVISFIMPGNPGSSDPGGYRDYVRVHFDSLRRPAVSMGTGASNLVLSEIDRKIDDGQPHSGLFRASAESSPISSCARIYSTDTMVSNPINILFLAEVRFGRTFPDPFSEIVWVLPPEIHENCSGAYLL